MRTLAIAILSCACAGRQVAWTTLAPADVPDGGEAFVLIGYNALHLANVDQVDGHLHARVVHAWALPRAGAYAIADDSTTTSPEEVARRAGWPELRIANARLDVPITAVRSARAVVGVEPDDDGDPPSGDPPIATAIVTLLELAAETAITVTR